MYTNVTEEFLTKLSEPSRHFVIRLKGGNAELPLNVVTAEFTTGTCGNRTFAVGCAFAASARFTIRKTGIPLEGREVFAELGLQLDDDSYEYVPFGHWTIQKPDTQTDGITFMAVDRIASKFSEEYVTNLTYPAQISAVLSELATKTGVSIVCNLQTTQQISKAISGVTNRGALALIAGTLLGNAWCDRNGVVRITSYKAASQNVQVEYRYVKPAPTMDETESSIDGIKVYTSDDRQDTYITYGSDHMIDLTDPYMTESVLQTVSVNLVGLKYNGGSVSFMGNPLIDPSDFVTFTGGTSLERESNLVTHNNENIITNTGDTFIVDNYATYYVPCMEVAQRFDGGLTSTVTAPGSFEITTKTYATGAITAALERQAISTALAQETADVAQETAETAQETADSALAKANYVQDVAENAVILANGKNKIYYQSSRPTSGMSVGDLWFDTGNGNAIYEYKSSEWVLHQLAQGAIAANSITGNEIIGNTIRSNHIVSRTITGEQIAVGTITATNIVGDSLSAIYADLGTITAGVIKSSNYSYSSGHYSSAGFIIDVNNQIIRGKNFSIENGTLYGQSVHLTGEINAQQGTIGGCAITNGVLKIANANINSISASKITGSKSLGSWGINFDDGTMTIGDISANNITSGTLNVARIGGHSVPIGKLSGSLSGGNSWGIDFTSGTMSIGTLAVGKITGTLGSTSSGNWGIDFTNGTMAIGRLAVSQITGILGSTSSGSWGIDFTNGTMSIGTISATNITTGTLRADVIAANSIAVSKLTGSIKDSGNTWEINLTNGSMTVGNINANNIRTGTLSADVIAGSSIKAEKLDIANLQSLSANLGTINAGVLKSANYSKTGSGYFSSQGVMFDLNNATLISPGLYIYAKSTNSIVAVNGQVTATSGQIGGLKILDGNTLYTGDHSTWAANASGIFISSGQYSFSVGANAKFYITNTGQVHCNGGIIYLDTSTNGAASLIFRTSDTERLKISASSVQVDFTVGSSSVILRLMRGSTQLARYYGPDNSFTFDVPNVWLSYNSSSNVRFTVQSASFQLYFGTASSYSGIYIQSRKPSTTSVTVNNWLIKIAASDGAMTTGATYVEGGSDARLKDVIGDTREDETLYILRETTIKDFSYKSDEYKLRRVGVIAQQLRDVMLSHNIGYRPYFIISKNDDVMEDIDCHDLNTPEEKVTYSVGYSNFIPILWKGWQIHDNYITALEQRIVALETELEELKGTA